jgi:hypothetical protein
LDLFLFAGQSNALGFGNNGPAPYTLTARVQIWTDTDGDGVGDAFNYMRPGVNTGTPANPAAWGPEVEFANQWLAANPEGILWLGKVAKGSTPLDQASGLDWSPSSDDEMFDRAKLVANQMLSNLGETSLDGVFWMQGEQDALAQTSAQSYAGHLTDLLAAIRLEWMHDLNGYVGVGRITDAAILPYSLDVRQAQWQVDQLDVHMESFKTIGYQMQADGLHYASDGQIALGEAFYDNWAT